MNILVSVNKRYVRYLLVLMASVYFNHPGERADFYVLGRKSELSGEAEKEIISYAESWNQKAFVTYVPEERWASFPTTPRWSVDTYFWLMAHEYLPKEIDRCLKLDVDMIVDRNISEFYRTEFGENYVALCLLSPMEITRISGGEVNRKVGNAGTALVHLERFRRDVTMQTYLDCYRNCPEADKKSFTDETALNALFGKKAIWKEACYYNCSPRYYDQFVAAGKKSGMGIDKPAIIHYIFVAKPWDVADEKSAFHALWWRYAKLTPHYRDLLLEMRAKTDYYGRIVVDIYQRQINELRMSKTRLENAVNFLKDLREDSLTTRRFETFLERYRGKSVSVLKCKDNAGLIFLDSCKRYGVNIAFRSPANSLNALSEQEFAQCRSADVIVNCNAHDSFNPARDGVRPVMVWDILKFPEYFYASTQGDTKMEHYDVGLYGVWPNVNYGSIATYFALHHTLTNMGKSVLMIDKPVLHPNDFELGMTHSRRFAMERYHISRQYPLEEIKEVNALCDAFVLGSDQLWNYGVSKRLGKAFYLDFVEDNKKKISYAVSFGHDKDFAPPEERVKISELMSRFDGISVREDDGVRLCREFYGIRAKRVLDPVFLPEPDVYRKLAEKSVRTESEPYLLAYILDPTPEKRMAIEHLSKKLGLKAVCILDGTPQNFQDNQRRMGLPCVENVEIETWLYYFSHAEFIITDSSHGVCFSIIFRKNFIPIVNKNRGPSRFWNLARIFAFEERLVMDPKRVLTDESLLNPVAFDSIEPVLLQERQDSMEWLRKKLEEPKKSMETLKNENRISILRGDLHPDVKKCQMAAALLRDYGIRHVVIASGARHVELVRFLEKNDCFQIYHVTDERGASFFGLGLAEKLNAPVAVCCTSGTASSNFASAAAEAFYQHIPLIFITADRYATRLNQREEQMIPQENLYGAVSLKSITLPERGDQTGLDVSRRRICEALLEVTRRTPGPVHINIPISFYNRMPLADSAYSLENIHYSRIFRYRYSPDREPWKAVVNKLSTLKTLVVYGQNHPLSEFEQITLENFCKRFNCVICTDYLSNVHCSKSINAYNMLNRKGLPIQELNPDIVITVYGSNICAIHPLVRQFKHFGHWEVMPSGEIADPYAKLNRVFECTPTEFFRRVNYMVGDVTAKTDFFEAWKKRESLSDAAPSSYGQKWAVSKIIERIPAGSLLHLANSNSVRFASCYQLQDSVEVYCNRGTNGIDGSASAFMGQCAISDCLCFLLIGDLSFFYDMNSLWNKSLKGNIRIMMFQNNGAGLLKGLESPSISFPHSAVAEGWVKSLGFTYLSSSNQEEFDRNIERFVSDEDTPMFFEVFC